MDVWIMRLDAGRPPEPGVARSVEAEERATAARFARPRDASAFVHRRAFVRTVLAGYVGADPADLRFARGAAGKPALRGARPATTEFSVSSSDGVALCAVGREPLGIDVERIRPDLDWRELSERFFSAAEHEALRWLGPRAFFAAWTLKEAAVKARGETLARGVEGLDVRAALRGGQASAGGLGLLTFQLGREFVAALAVTARAPRIRVLEWAQASWSRATTPSLSARFGGGVAA